MVVYCPGIVKNRMPVLIILVSKNYLRVLDMVACNDLRKIMNDDL